MLTNNWKKLLLLLVVLFGVAFPLITADPYILNIAITCFLNSLVALSIAILVRTGMVSFGHAGFVAVAGYTSAILATRLGVSPWLGLFAGTFMAFVVGIVVGVLLLRIPYKGFILLTFAFGEGVRHLLIYGGTLTGGYQGIPRIPAPTFPGVDFYLSRIPGYYLIFLLLMITAIVLYQLDRSRPGKTMRAIAQSPALARSVGINVTWYKLLAFSLAGLFAGVAGWFQAHYLYVIAPTMFTFHLSFYALIYVVVGGIGSAVAGPIIGAVVLSMVGEMTRGLLAVAPVFYAVIVVLIIFFLPQGLVSLPQRLSWLWIRKEVTAEVPPLPRAVQPASFPSIKERIWHWLKLKK